MCCRHLAISVSYRKAVERPVKTAQRLGHLRPVTYLLAILAVVDGQNLAPVAWVFRVHVKTVATWGRVLCGSGRQGVPPLPTGRPPALPPTPTAARVPWIEERPGKAGGRGACWRSPLLPPLLDDRCGVLYNVFASAPFLTNPGRSYQTAVWVAEPLDADTRHVWCPTPWPQGVRLAKERQAVLLLGEAASFPPWGPLTYTWAPGGLPPQTKWYSML